uniref:Uncharacterized protein n=1 Tax=Oryza barthii TaxID=65489 RepID=A0A679BCS6_9ORYZ|nr:hypothetical protein [Oryza barthii]BBF89306.1 hypothetical protein [Oryza barthii]
MSTVKLKRADTYKQELRACFFTKDMKDREAILRRHREECKKICRDRRTYCPPEMPCCCVMNAPASSPVSVENESGDGNCKFLPTFVSCDMSHVWCAESPAIQHRNNHSFSFTYHQPRKKAKTGRTCMFDIL